jgi:hypothetical protein
MARSKEKGKSPDADGINLGSYVDIAATLNNREMLERSLKNLELKLEALRKVSDSGEEEIGQELAKEASILEREKLEDKEKKISLEKKPEDKELTKFESLINSLKYPARASINIFFKKAMIPVKSVAILSVISLATGMTDSIAGFIIPVALQAKLVMAAIGGILLTSFSLGSIPSFNRLLLKAEEKNRITFSDLFTLSKFFITKDSIFRDLFKITNPEYNGNFVGELNFVGLGTEKLKIMQTVNNPEDEDPTVAILRSGAEGLYNLAIACESNDPRLKDIELFSGISLMLSPKFKKLGFIIHELSKSEKKSLFLDYNAAYYFGTITREDLVKHKKFYARIANIKS